MVMMTAVFNFNLQSWRPPDGRRPPPEPYRPGDRLFDGHHHADDGAHEDDDHEDDDHEDQDHDDDSADDHNDDHDGGG